MTIEEVEKFLRNALDSQKGFTVMSRVPGPDFHDYALTKDGRMVWITGGGFGKGIWTGEELGPSPGSPFETKDATDFIAAWRISVGIKVS